MAAEKKAFPVVVARLGGRGGGFAGQRVGLFLRGNADWDHDA
jgi:hypothetical protein